MIKSLMAAVVAVPVLATAAVAGPYVNVESNSAWYTRCSKCDTVRIGNITEFHIGYEGTIGDKTTYFFQGGPAIVKETGNEDEEESSAKAGITFNLTEQFELYGEVWTISDGFVFDGSQITTKVGGTYRF